MRYSTPFFGLVLGLLLWFALAWMFAPPIAERAAQYIGENSVPKAIIPPHLDKDEILRKARESQSHQRADELAK